MANNIWQKATKFAATALELLKRQVKLPALLTNRYTVADFAGAEGDVVNVRRPPILRAREKGWRNNNAIEVDTLEQTKIQVALDSHPYSAVALTSEEATLDEVNYVRDVQAPQVQALLDFFEDTIVHALQGADYTLGVVFDPESADTKQSDPRKVASRARKLFQDAHVPTTGRYWLVGSAVAEAIRDHEKLLDVDTSGLPEAVRDGVVTRLSGFTIIEVDALDEGESYFMHESAVALATVAPVVPQGAAKGGAVAAGNGLAVTQVWDYDGDHLNDRSVVHAFVGATPVLDPEIGSDGTILHDSEGKVSLTFVRAIKVSFGSPAPAGATKFTFTPPDEGTFNLTVDGETVAGIAFDASNSDIADALNSLDGVSGAKVTGNTIKTIRFTEPVILTASAGTVA